MNNIDIAVEANVPGLEFITRLRPVTYNLNMPRQNAIIYADKPNQTEWEGKYDIEKMCMSGLIAQEVDSAANAVGYNFSGIIKPSGPNDLYQLGYCDFVMPLGKSVQELSKQKEELMKRFDEQRKLNEQLIKEIDELKKKW